MRHNRRRKPERSTGPETITPAMAEEWLATRREGKAYRVENPVKAGEIATDIMRGLWQVDGNTIKFNNLGELIDGQHRLRACVLAKKPIESYVVWGLDPAVIDRLDTGQKRTLAQVLGYHGYVRSGALAASVHLLWCHGRGTMKYSILDQRNIRPNNTEVLNLLESEPVFTDSTVWYSRAAGTNSVLMNSGASSVLLHYLVEDKARVGKFLLGAIKGEDLSSTDPRFILRRTYERMTARRETIRTAQAFGRMVKAWNIWAAGGSVFNIKPIIWKHYEGEPFPLIEGADRFPGWWTPNGEVKR